MFCIKYMFMLLTVRRGKRDKIMVFWGMHVLVFNCIEYMFMLPTDGGGKRDKILVFWDTTQQF